MLLPRWFLIVNGLSLLLLGLTLLWVRVRAAGAQAEPDEEPGAGLRARPRVARVGVPALLLSSRSLLGVVWALLCCGAGGALLLMATGRVAQPGVRSLDPAAGRRAAPIFPTER